MLLKTGLYLVKNAPWITKNRDNRDYQRSFLKQMFKLFLRVLDLRTMLGPFLVQFLLTKHIIGKNCVLGVVSGRGKYTLTVYYEWCQVRVKQP